MKRRLCAILLAIVATGAVAKDCWPWGATGHEWVSGIAIEKLTDSLPEFIRTPEVAAEIAVLGRAIDSPDMMFVIQRPAQIIEVLDIIHPDAFTEIDLGHPGFDTP